MRNAVPVRIKGCGGASSFSQKKGKNALRKTHSCGLCGGKGHNRKSCFVHGETTLMSQTQGCSSVGWPDEEDDDEECFYVNVDTVSYTTIFEI